MVRLSAADLRGIVGVAAELAVADDLATFRDNVSVLVRRLVPVDIASYNEIDPASGAAFAIVDPPDVLFDGSIDALAKFAMQNPLIACYARTGDPRALKFSDFLTRRQLHRLDIYNELYRQTGVEHQMAFALPTTAGLVVGVSINRGRADFTERDRTVLDLLRPAFAQTHRALRDRAALAALQAADGNGGSSAVVVLGPYGTVEAATPAGRRWLASHGSAGEIDRLPSPLREWVAARRGAAHATFAERDGSQVDVRLVPGGPGRLDALVVHRRTEPGGGPSALGLTAREADVLGLVARGLSNLAIARSLGVSDRTVGKHLERVYAKLGVTNRTAAVRRAAPTLEACGD